MMCYSDEDSDTVDTGGGSKTVLPVPVPIFLPAPMAMFNAPTPYPLPMPLPIPVPCFVPTTRNSIAAIMKQLKVVTAYTTNMISVLLGCILSRDATDLKKFNSFKQFKY